MGECGGNCLLPTSIQYRYREQSKAFGKEEEISQVDGAVGGQVKLWFIERVAFLCAKSFGRENKVAKVDKSVVVKVRIEAGKAYDEWGKEWAEFTGAANFCRGHANASGGEEFCRGKFQGTEQTVFDLGRSAKGCSGYFNVGEGAVELGL